MIYYVFNESIQEKFELCKVMSRFALRPSDSRIMIHVADFIFTIKDGKTSYVKNRFGDKDYFSEEDIAVMILSAVPM